MFFNCWSVTFLFWSMCFFKFFKPWDFLKRKWVKKIEATLGRGSLLSPLCFQNQRLGRTWSRGYGEGGVSLLSALCFRKHNLGRSWRRDPRPLSRVETHRGKTKVVRPIWTRNIILLFSQVREHVCLRKQVFPKNQIQNHNICFLSKPNRNTKTAPLPALSANINIEAGILLSCQVRKHNKLV